jgi:hypothetical protein
MAMDRASPRGFRKWELETHGASALPKSCIKYHNSPSVQQWGSRPATNAQTLRKQSCKPSARDESFLMTHGRKAGTNQIQLRPLLAVITTFKQSVYGRTSIVDVRPTRGARLRAMGLRNLLGSPLSFLSVYWLLMRNEDIRRLHP